ncbi:MAG: hypothetical protein LBU89_02465 [Fibromonadaceae bacterium]|jgi:hypothetical protein|nr:hypothetical protein [Fibromonadaceae bacterium]
MNTKLKILALMLTIVSFAFAGGDGKKNPEEWKAFKECKQRVEQGSDEDCSALKPAWKKDGKKGDQKDVKNCTKDKKDK